MPPTTPGTGPAPPPVPSMLDLVRLSRRLLFPPGGEDLYRQIAILTDMAEGQEVLHVACGKGVSVEYFVREYGVHGAGVEEDARLVAEAEARSREAGIAAQLQFQTGRADSLPYRDGVFDVAVGEIGLAAGCAPADAVRELVRVTRPGGAVVLVQLVWKAPVDEARRRLLSEHLGARPLMLVEWKRLLRAESVVDLHTEDWSDEHTSFRPRAAKPFPDFAEIFSFAEKIAILRRAWARWGWQGVRTVLEREREVHRLLTHERILGLDLIKGLKWPLAAEGTEAAEAAGVTPGAPDVSAETPADPADAGGEGDGRHDPETAGLPLFGGDDEPR